MSDSREPLTTSSPCRGGTGDQAELTQRRPGEAHRLACRPERSLWRKATGQRLERQAGRSLSTRVSVVCWCEARGRGTQRPPAWGTQVALIWPCVPPVCEGVHGALSTGVLKKCVFPEEAKSLWTKQPNSKDLGSGLPPVRPPDPPCGDDCLGHSKASSSCAISGRSGRLYWGGFSSRRRK